MGISCNSGIEYQYYQSVYKMGSTEQQLDLCAFCGTTLSASDASKLKKLLAEVEGANSSHYASIYYFKDLTKHEVQF